MPQHNVTLRGIVELDDEQFFNCVFDDAILIYRGGTPPTINNCQFLNATWHFEDSAGRTISFLQALASPGGGLDQVLLNTFPTLRRS